MNRFVAALCLGVLAVALFAPVAANVSNHSINPQNLADSNGPVPPIPPGSGNFVSLPSVQA